MRAKTANQGREIAPFDGAPATAEAVIAAAVRAYNDTPQKGLSGLSPNEAFAQRRSERRPVTWSIEAAAYALAERTERVSEKGRVRLANRLYDLEGAALAAAPKERITVLHGPFIDGVVTEFKGELMFAPEMPRGSPIDPEGAKYTHRRRKAFDAAVRRRADGLPVPDALMDVIQDHRPTVDLIEAQKDVVRLSLSKEDRKTEAERQAAEQRAHAEHQDAVFARIAGRSLPLREAG
jgi:hypothetical protein